MSDSKSLPTKRTLPFYIVIIIESDAEKIGNQPGYRHSAKGVGVIADENIDIAVTRYLGWSHADHLSQLKFYIEVDGKALIPLINTKNRT